jgi:hypothetical protein
MRNRRGPDERIADAVIADPEQHTVMDAGGAVRSIQAANVDMPESELAAIWDPMHLERLARTYWKYLSRVTLGLIRVRYTEAERSVVLLAKPLVLLRFRAPDYEMSSGRGIVRWRIMDGLLVARRDEGYLELDVRRSESERPGFARVHVEIEVANFYPAIATFVARWFYQQTQSRIHVLVTHGFLRSLARLELEPSAVGRFALEGATAPAAGEDAERWSEAEVTRTARPGKAVTVGDTPWAVVGGLAAVAVAGALLVALRRR